MQLRILLATFAALSTVVAQLDPHRHRPDPTTPPTPPRNIDTTSTAAADEKGGGGANLILLSAAANRPSLPKWITTGSALLLLLLAANIQHPAYHPLALFALPVLTHAEPSSAPLHIDLGTNTSFSNATEEKGGFHIYTGGGGAISEASLLLTPPSHQVLLAYTVLGLLCLA
ncbi:hypothetical protein MMC19_006935 [Ptychographa xylographoides]|nr:hypothetical protein [Ptychographa xylographoides]